jgi:FMN phosphatase YigB (HAD superfamily)
LEPRQEALKAAITDLFTKDRHSLDQWLTGGLSASQVTEHMTGGYDHATLQDELAKSVRLMHMDIRLVLLLQRVPRNISRLALATDNVDCFAQNCNHIEDFSDLFSDALCSSTLGVTKRDPERFFGPYLREHGLAANECFLVDDSAANCAAFTEFGGRALQYTMDFYGLSQLTKVIMPLVWITRQQRKGARLSGYAVRQG